jgi:hypothetical protein
LKKDKTEKEVYAALMLVKLKLIEDSFSLEWVQDLKEEQDHPDLKIRDFGIEVTESLLPYEGEKDKIVNALMRFTTIDEAKNWFIDQKRQSKHFSVTKINESHYVFHGHQVYNGKVTPYDITVTKYPFFKQLSISSGGGYNEDAVINDIVNVIAKKSRKFLGYSHPEQYKERGLFLVRYDMMIGRHPIDLVPLQTAIDKSEFDILYLLLTQKIIVIRKNLSSEEYSYTEEDKNEVSCEVASVLSTPDYEELKNRFLKNYDKYPNQFSVHEPKMV